MIDNRSFTDWQHAQPGFPFARSTDDLEISWVQGPGDDGPVLVPASWAHLNWRTGPRRRDPWLHHVNYAGIATGQGVADATRRGLLELIERDALSLWWHLDLPARGIDPAESAVKATLEAIHSWVFTQGLLEPDGWVFDAIAAGVLSAGLYLPHRPGRDYLAGAGPRQERVRDLGAQAQVWLDPEVQRRLLPRFTSPRTQVGIEDLPTATEQGLYAALAAGGHEVVVCDLTTPDIALTPLRVVRVCARGLVPNAPAAFPYYGLPRWAELAGRPPTPESLLLLPPPSL